MAANATPQGCGLSLDSLYYNLCDLGAVWGIVLEAFAAAGVVASFVLLMVVLASLPFLTAPSGRGSVGLQAGFLLGTLGLFGLTFAFIVGKDFATCASRRFLFGVLFAACFACLLMQGVRLSVLGRRGRGPPAWALCLGAGGLWLVEVLINVEWLIVTVVRYPIESPAAANATADATADAVPCNIANQDFVMALIYVMNLLLAVLVASVAALAGERKRWRKGAAFVLATGLLSAGVWVAWVVMYVYGNERRGGPTWDDPTLAIALVANAWVFLLLHAVPELCFLSEEEEEEEEVAAPPGFGGELFPSRGRGYETILKDQGAQNMFMENKAFSMDEPNTGNKPVSPYSGYSGQLRSSVYQPTELALITQGLGTQHAEGPYEASVLPRASAASPAPSGGSSEPGAPGAHTPGNSGNGLHMKPQW